MDPLLTTNFYFKLGEKRILLDFLCTKNGTEGRLEKMVSRIKHEKS